MKTCGYCGNEYDDKEPKCPQCGATLLKHTKGAESAAAERERLKEEMYRKRKTRNIILGIGAAVIALVIIIIISRIVGFVNDPQREIAKESKELLNHAEQQVDDGEYDDALDTLNRIDTAWDDYENVENVRLEAVKGQLKVKLAEYEAAGNYQAIISMINENVTDINADAEVKSAYESAVQNYKAEAISSAEEYAAAGDYTSARSALTVAQNFIGEAVEISEKLKEINQKEVLEVVLAYEAEENYEDAITYLDDKSDIVSGSADLQAKQSAYIEKYRANVIKEASNAYKKNGYEAAVSLLNSALKVLTNDSSLLSEREKYEGYAPVSLYNVTWFYDGHEEVYGAYRQDNTTLTDKLGNTYAQAIRYVWSGGDGCEDIYYTDGQYSRFTAVLFVPSQRDAWADDHNEDLRFYVYGDGKLLYQSPRMHSKHLPVEIEIDITGVEQLSIVCNTSGAPGTVDGSMGLADMYLWKD